MVEVIGLIDACILDWKEINEMHKREVNKNWREQTKNQDLDGEYLKREGL